MILAVSYVQKSLKKKETVTPITSPRTLFLSHFNMFIAVNKASWNLLWKAKNLNMHVFVIRTSRHILDAVLVASIACLTEQVVKMGWPTEFCSAQTQQASFDT